MVLSHRKENILDLFNASFIGEKRRGVNRFDDGELTALVEREREKERGDERKGGGMRGEGE